MTLRFIDSFQDGQALLKYDGGSSVGTARVTSTPRLSGAAAVGGGILLKSIPAVSEVFVAGAFYWPSVSLGLNVMMFYGDSGATQHVTLYLNSSGKIEARRGSSIGTLLGTSTTTFATNTWYHLQVRMVISDTVGVVQMRINGSSVNDLDLTAQDTKNAGTNTTIDQVRLHNSQNSSYLITDVAILDTAGSANNTWPGDCKVQALAPTGNGNSSQGVGSDSDSVNNYALVSELPFTTTGYVSVATDGQGDSYAVADLTAGTNTVKGVQVVSYAKKSDAGAKTLKRRIRSGGSNYAGASQFLSTSDQLFTEILENDPATSAAWTVANVNAIEVGFEAASS